MLTKFKAPFLLTAIKCDPSTFTLEAQTSFICVPRGITLDYFLEDFDDNNHDTQIVDARLDINSIDFMHNDSFSGTDYTTDNKIFFTILRHYLTRISG